MMMMMMMVMVMVMVMMICDNRWRSCWWCVWGIWGMCLDSTIRLKNWAFTQTQLKCCRGDLLPSPQSKGHHRHAIADTSSSFQYFSLHLHWRVVSLYTLLHKALKCRVIVSLGFLIARVLSLELHPTHKELHLMHKTMKLAVDPPPLPESEASYGFARLLLGLQRGRKGVGRVLFGNSFFGRFGLVNLEFIAGGLAVAKFKAVQCWDEMGWDLSAYQCPDRKQDVEKSWLPFQMLCIVLTSPILNTSEPLCAFQDVNAPVHV